MRARWLATSTIASMRGESLSRSVVNPVLGLTLSACMAVLASACSRAQPIPAALDESSSAPSSTAAHGTPSETTMSVQVQNGFGRIPLHFEANEGQTNSEVRYFSRGPGYTVYLTPGESVFALRRRIADDHGSEGPWADASARPGREPQAAETSVLRVRPVGGSAKPELHALEGLPGKANYFVGNDPSRWRTNVPLFAKVRAQGVYPGIDLVYHGNPEELEYDFELAPWADPREVRLSFAGQAAPLRIDAGGNLIIPLAGGELVQRRPVAYQDMNGQRQPVSASFELHRVTSESGEQQEVGFTVASYDPRRSLVIDPVLAYSTYIGDAHSSAIAVDATGSAYLTGSVFSFAAFPIQNAYQSTPNGAASEVFVTKLAPDGDTLVYSTYLGGGSSDAAQSIAVDAARRVYVAGLTVSSDFPTTVGAFQTVYAGGTGASQGDGFVTELNAAGDALVYSTYLGGGDADIVNGLAVDASGSAYVAGYTASADFPTASALDTSLSGPDDGFVAKLNPAGTGLIYSTYLGGTGSDGASAAALDGSGNVYVTGFTLSGDFPIRSAFQAARVGAIDIFLTKLSSTGALVYSTYLGGHEPFDESSRGLAVDAAGSAIVVGETAATDFPTHAALQGVYPGGAHSGFITKFSPAGNALVYSTYLGGTNTSSAFGVAVGGGGVAFVTGETKASNFPTQMAFQGTYAGDTSGTFGDVFVTKLTPSGGIDYSTFLGGTGSDGGIAIAARPVGLGEASFVSAYITGATGGLSSSPADFPTQNPFRNYRSCVGNPCWDVFVTKIAHGIVQAQQAVATGDTVVANPGGLIEVSVTSPNAGNVTIVGGVGLPSPLTIEFDITAPPATPANPLVLAFRIDASLSLPSILNVIKNLDQVQPCTGALGTASPDPCIASKTTLLDNDLLVTVNTSTASLWTINDASEFAACPQVPKTGCQPAQSTKSQLQLTNKSPDDKDKLTWKWTSSANVGTSDFGSPLTASVYQLCIYTNGNLRLDGLMPAGGLCGGHPCWRLTPTGFLYSDRDLTPLGISKMTLKAGAPGKGKIVITGKGVNLADTVFPLGLPTKVQLMRRDNDTCWEATYSTATISKADSFSAKSD